MSDFEWTPARLDLLRVLWAQVPQLSTAEIGRRMGVSKNSVVSKANRLRLAGRASPIVRRAEGAPPPPPTRRASAKAAALAVLESIRPGPVLDCRPLPIPPPVVPVVVARPVYHRPARVGRCCWPIGEPRTPDFHFCDVVQVVPGKPYCAEHCAVAYVKLPPRSAEPGEFVLPTAANRFFLGLRG